MKKYDHAFTLIEMLLGLSIFSLIALSLYGTFSSGMQLSRRSQSTGQIEKEIRWSLERIAKDLNNMAPYDFSRSYPDRLAFSGTMEEVSFLTKTPKGLSCVHYVLKPLEFGSVYKTIVNRKAAKKSSIMTRYEETRSHFALVREETPFIDSLQESRSENIEEDILIPRLADEGLQFSFAYVENQPEGPTLVWKDVWELSYLPSGVRVSMTMVDENQADQTLSIQKDIFIPKGLLGKESL
ncbi:MAG: prepilin-type N-terminal cleavage/methylation domain-containing protein [Candidatus Omnitrophota bacterium]